MLVIGNRGALLFILVAGWLCACSGTGDSRTVGTGDADSDTDGDADADSDSDADGDGDTDSSSELDTGCEEVDFPVAGHPPDILILLDRSNSMAFGDPQPWDIVTAALTEMTAAMDPQIRFGLMVFPYGTANCGLPTGVPEVDIADINAGSISTALSVSMPNGGGTPTASALEIAAGYLGSLGDESDKFILLATDGAPNCSSDLTLSCGTCTTTQLDGITCYSQTDCLDDILAVDTAQAVHDDLGINIYVVGVGGVVGTWDLVMNAIASSGGTEGFYAAEDSASLEWALSYIAAEAVGCTFTVDWDTLGEGVSSDPDLVNLFADGPVVPFSEDCSNPFGWHWLDGNTIEMCASLCEDYKSGVVQVVTASFGCTSIIE